MEFKSINQLKSLIDENKISVKEIAQTYIKKIKEKKDLNIFIYFDEDKINNQVKEIEKLPNTECYVFRRCCAGRHLLQKLNCELVCGRCDQVGSLSAPCLSIARL